MWIFHCWSIILIFSSKLWRYNGTCCLGFGASLLWFNQLAFQLLQKARNIWQLNSKIQNYIWKKHFRQSFMTSSNPSHSFFFDAPWFHLLRLLMSLFSSRLLVAARWSYAFTFFSCLFVCSSAYATAHLMKNFVQHYNYNLINSIIALQKWLFVVGFFVIRQHECNISNFARNLI